MALHEFSEWERQLERDYHRNIAWLMGAGLQARMTLSRKFSLIESDHELRCKILRHAIYGTPITIWRSQARALTSTERGGGR